MLKDSISGRKTIGRVILYMYAVLNVSSVLLNPCNFGHQKGPLSCGPPSPSSRFAEQLGRHNYVTPTSYLELISSFKGLLGSKRGEVLKLKKRYEVGLQKLAFAASQVSASRLVPVSAHCQSCSQASTYSCSCHLDESFVTACVEPYCSLRRCSAIAAEGFSWKSI